MIHELRKIRFINYIIYKSKLLYQKYSTLINYIIAIFLPVSIIFLKLHSPFIFGSGSANLIFYNAILLTSWIGGFGPSIVILIISTFSILYFLIPPYYTFQLTPQFIFSILIFISEGLLIALILQRSKNKEILLNKRLKQQSSLALLAHYALNTPSIAYFFQKMSLIITETLNVNYCEVLQFLPEKKSFLVREGIGWKTNQINKKIVPFKENTSRADSLIMNKPVIINDYKQDQKYKIPEFLEKRKVRSSVTFAIPQENKSFGIIGIYSEKKKDFSEDLYFIKAISSIIATTIQKKNSNASLKESELRFRRLFESNIIGTFILKTNGTFIDANKTFLSLIGYSKNDLNLNKIKIETITPEEFMPITKKSLNDLKTSGASYLHEKIYIKKTGKRIPVMVAATKIDRYSDKCIGFALDISKQKELESRKDKFIAMVSHELKTPITSLKVLTQYLERKMINSNQIENAAFLKKIHKQTNNLTSVIDELLDFTQIQTGKLKLNKKIFDFSRIAKETCNEIINLNNSHKIILNIEPDIMIKADQNRITQVITNFVLNAIRYSPAGSDILIKEAADHDNVTFSVTDYGFGIEKKYQKDIFKQFFRVNENRHITYPGMGMGLFISKEIINRHQGKIWVESEKNHGSSFYFSVPLMK